MRSGRCTLLSEESKNYMITEQCRVAAVVGLNLNIVAMALSGYTEHKKTLWREMCDSLRMKLGNPYLSAMFAFLTAEDYNDILVCIANDLSTHSSIANNVRS